MTKKVYTPSKKILEKYANVLVNFALNSGKGVKKGEVVYLIGAECTKPLFLEIHSAIINAGAHVITNYLPDDRKGQNMNRNFFLDAKKHQLEFFPEKYMKGLVDTMDHSVYIISETDKESLKGIDPKKIMAKGLAMKPFMDWRRDKEADGDFTWTLGLYGTPEAAKVVGLTDKEYWGEIIKACYLNEKDPVKKWKELYRDMEKYRGRLNKITAKTEKFHIYGEDADLWIAPGEKRQWLMGSGRNIPSFEIFTSPDWRGVDGWIYFNHPLYRYGNIMQGIRLEFKKGIVVKSSAKKGEKILKEMIKTKNANKIGEFSLTDRRHSKITKAMGETLFDENMGGKQGNTHLALGAAYRETYDGDESKLSKKQLDDLGFNDSSVHTDIISTTRRTVTAHLKDGTEKIIYKDGEFVL